MPYTADRDGTPAGSVGPPTGSPDANEDRALTGDSSRDSSAVVDNPAVLRLKDLPKEVGVMLVSVGAVGVVLPGMMGAPAIIAGGLVLWPETFRGVEEWLRRRNPGLYHRGMQQLGRFLDDQERRYPDLTKK
jgi:hypothetical protein